MKIIHFKIFQNLKKKNESECLNNKSQDKDSVNDDESEYQIVLIDKSQKFNKTGKKSIPVSNEILKYSFIKENES